MNFNIMKERAMYVAIFSAAFLYTLIKPIVDYTIAYYYRPTLKGIRTVRSRRELTYTYNGKVYVISTPVKTG